MCLNLVFCSNFDYSSRKKLEQLDYDEVCSNDLQLMLTNRADEMDYSELEDEMIVACEGICEWYNGHSIYFCGENLVHLVF